MNTARETYRCPGCGGMQCGVIDSRVSGSARRRRRRCLRCSMKFTTYEIAGSPKHRPMTHYQQERRLLTLIESAGLLLSEMQQISRRIYGEVDDGRNPAD